jgi:hypothetical protein
MTQTKDEEVAARVQKFAFLATLVFCLIMCGCGQSNRARLEAPPGYQPSPPAPEVRMSSVLTPKLPEVQEAVRRVFKDAAVVDSTSSPRFLAGDFNGDSSQDIAVIVKPVPGKLAQMNEEFPAWLLRDPFAADRSVSPQLRVEEQDVMLAIIHGYGANDWRDSQATQTYLLKNAVGSNMEVRTPKEFLAAHSGRKLPRPQGDLIGESVRGTLGYLYYAGANYLWYDPKTFKPKPEIGMVHSARSQ